MVHDERTHSALNLYCSSVSSPNARLTATKKSEALNVLCKKPAAPSPMARRSASSSLWAVIKIIGRSGRRLFILHCKSRPLMLGIRTSVIRQLAVSMTLDCRNASAEGKTAAIYPAASSRLSSDSRIRKSSSTTAMKLDGMLVASVTFWILGGNARFDYSMFVYTRRVRAIWLSPDKCYGGLGKQTRKRSPLIGPNWRT